MSTRSYLRAAEQGRLAPANGRAIRRLGTHQGADIVVVAGYGGGRGSRVLRVRYYDGRRGAELRQRTHRVHGTFISRAVRLAILADLDETLLEVGRPHGARRPHRAGPESPGSQDSGTVSRDVPNDEEPEAPRALGSAADVGRGWGFGIAVGGGFGHRTSTVPVEGRRGGEGRFASSSFPAIYAAFDLWLHPMDDSSFRVGLGTRYYTSVGLQAEELGAMGTTQTVDSHAHRLSVGANADFALTGSAHSAQPLWMSVEVGWFFRMLESDASVSMPSYRLSGPQARLGLFLSLGRRVPVVLGVTPEVAFISSVSEEVAEAGALSDGLAVGFEAQLRLDVIPELSLDLVYRESHAFLESDRGGDMNDIERFGVLRLKYRP